MDIEVKGHSGCSIDIVREGKELFILKGTCDPKYVERLYQQALKLISNPFTECVKAPTEIKSTPHSA